MQRDADGCSGRRVNGRASGSGLTKAGSSISVEEGWLRVEV